MPTNNFFFTYPCTVHRDCLYISLGVYHSDYIVFGFNTDIRIRIPIPIRMRIFTA